MPRGQEGIGNRGVERVIEIRLNDRGRAQPLTAPGNILDRFRPTGVAVLPSHPQTLLGAEAHGDPVGDRRALQTADIENESWLESAGIERVGRAQKTRVVAPSNSRAGEHVG